MPEHWEDQDEQDMVPAFGSQHTGNELLTSEPSAMGEPNTGWVDEEPHL